MLFSEKLVILAIGLAVALRIFSVDSYLSILPLISIDLGTDNTTIQFSVFLSMLGGLIATLFWGYAGDRFGRRIPFLLGNTIFGITSLLSAFISDVNIFHILRFLQGFGASVIIVLGNTIISDMFSLKKSSQIFYFFSFLSSISSIISPVVAGFFGFSYIWRTIPFCIGTLSILLLIIFIRSINETFHPGKNFSNIKGMFIILKNKKFLYFSSLFPILFSGYWIFLIKAPSYFFNNLLLSPKEFSLIFSMNALSFGGFSLLSNYLTKKCKLQLIIKFGIMLNAIGAITFAFVAYFYSDSINLFMISTMLYVGGASIISAPSVSNALHLFPNNRATASAIRSLIYNLLTTISAYIPILYCENGMFVTSILICICSLICLILWIKMG